MYFVVTGFFEDRKFGTLHLGLLPCIAVTDYSWLIMVNNCNNEVCSPSNNNVLEGILEKERSVTTKGSHAESDLLLFM